eukprot:2010785-Pleurochrysis_carterae.AAC.4
MYPYTYAPELDATDETLERWQSLIRHRLALDFFGIYCAMSHVFALWFITCPLLATALRLYVFRFRLCPDLKYLDTTFHGIRKYRTTILQNTYCQTRCSASGLVWLWDSDSFETLSSKDNSAGVHCYARMLTLVAPVCSALSYNSDDIRNSLNNFKGHIDWLQLATQGRVLDIATSACAWSLVRGWPKISLLLLLSSIQANQLLSTDHAPWARPVIVLASSWTYPRVT